jgi:hypothetical protein
VVDPIEQPRELVVVVADGKADQHPLDLDVERRCPHGWRSAHRTLAWARWSLTGSKVLGSGGAGI